MDETLDAGLWTSRDESAEFETFTDDFGTTVRELMAPMPTRGLREGGPVEHNTRTLDRHTGDRVWARKGDDVASDTPFDTDMLTRPVEQFAVDHRRRSAVQIDLNRSDTQRDALREDFAPRDAQMYTGYNPVVPRKMRHFVPTRRSEQELAVVGTERRMEPRAAMASELYDAARAGALRMPAVEVDIEEVLDAMRARPSVGARKLVIRMPWKEWEE